MCCQRGLFVSGRWLPRYGVLRYHPLPAMSEKFPMTPAGFASMKVHLKRLKDHDRPANSKAIEIARGHGDLSENADYSAAKEEQGLIEAKIR